MDSRIIDTEKTTYILYRGNIFRNIINKSIGKTVILDKKELLITSSIPLTGSNLIDWYKKEASFIIKSKIELLSNIHQLPFCKIGVRDTKRIWGSCNSVKNISINAKLILTPDHIIEAIILHELTHTIHMNHKKVFWSYLHSICPDWDKHIRYLNTYKPLIYYIWENGSLPKEYDLTPLLK